MKIKIIEVKTGIDAAAEIREGTLNELPSMHDNWRLISINKLKNFQAQLHMYWLRKKSLGLFKAV